MKPCLPWYRSYCSYRSLLSQLGQSTLCRFDSSISSTPFWQCGQRICMTKKILMKWRVHYAIDYSENPTRESAHCGGELGNNCVEIDAFCLIHVAKVDKLFWCMFGFDSRQLVSTYFNVTVTKTRAETKSPGCWWENDNTGLYPGSREPDEQPYP